jgi:ribosome-binding protein aMBF1 (putative translation factor)
MPAACHDPTDPPEHTGATPLPRRRPGRTDPTAFTRAAIGPSAGEPDSPRPGRLTAAQRREDARPQLAAIAHRIARLRSLRGLSQAALARRAGLSRNTIHQLEHARTMTTLDRLWQIAGALEVRLGALVAEPGDSRWDGPASAAAGEGNVMADGAGCATAGGAVGPGAPTRG